MLRMCCKITVGAFLFEIVHSVEINTSFKNFTDTCMIELPRKVQNYEGKKLDGLIKRGDAVKVELGYDDELVTEFEGFVMNVKPTMPVQIECEDKMYLLKLLPVKPKSFENASVEDVLKYLDVKSKMNYQVIGDSVTLGDWDITPEYDTAAKVLKKLKDDYPILLSFIRNGELHVGDPYDASYAKTVDFAFGENIIEHALEYRRAEDVKYRIKMTSKNDDGKDVTVEVGDMEGDQRTFTEMNKSLTELKSLGNKYLEQLKYDGYRGKFTAFGIPVMRHGDIAKMVDSDEEEKAGKFYSDGIVKSFGDGGYRQVIELGKKAA